MTSLVQPQGKVSIRFFQLCVKCSCRPVAKNAQQHNNTAHKVLAKTLSTLRAPYKYTEEGEHLRTYKQPIWQV